MVTASYASTIQLRPPVAHVVRHVEGAAGKPDHVERTAPENMPDAVVELGARIAGVDVLLLATDDLGQVGFNEKPHRGARPVVEIGRLGEELLTSLLNETDVGRRPEHRIAQLLRRHPLERLVEREGVHEDGARNVSGVGRQAAVVLGVEILRQRAGSRADPATSLAMAGT